MSEAMPWRGPDADGLQEISVRGWSAAFSFRRLAIIDLSPLGLQPMELPEAGLTIVMNGEVFNYRELRAELAGMGHRFVSQSDTEVVLQAYAAWGKDCFRRLEGMYALSVWDRKSQTMYMVRDRFGVKPVYYFQSPDRFLFASEVRALLASGLVPRKLNRDVLSGYLQSGAICSPDSAIDNVFCLPAGSIGTWHDGAFKVEKYWDLGDSAGAWMRTPKSPSEVGELLREAVAMELVSDVPIGAFLSGGIDSSAIVACASEQSADLRTVSLVFQEASLDERRYSQIVADRYHTAHTPVEISADTASEYLPKMAALQDQPCADGLNTYLASKAARESGLTVALSGLGGDEIFCGYTSFDLAEKWSRYGAVVRAMPSFVRASASRVVGLVRGQREDKGARLVAETTDTESMYGVIREVFNVRQTGELLGAMPTKPMYLALPGGLHPVDAMTLLEYGRYMEDTTLRQADIMSMATSLELRVPLLNYRLAEAVMAIPPKQRLDKHVPKPLIVNGLKNPLPDAIVHRKKGTFTLPFDKWLRTCSRELTQDLLTGSRARERGLFDPAAAQRVWDGFLDKKPGFGWTKVWTIASFEAWCRANLDGAA